MNHILYTELESPIGPLTVAATAQGVCAMEFAAAAEGGVQLLTSWAKRWSHESRLLPLGAEDSPEAADAARMAEEAAKQVEAYFLGRRRSFELPLDLQGTEFQVKVWRALTNIPYGEVRSYKQVAEAIGSPKAVRAVGGANNRNPLPLIVPCHRVIGANGTMVGYGGGLPIKESLLKHEGYLRTDEEE